METQCVLIVDDERNIRLTLKGALEAIGLEVDAVFQGEEALQKLAEKSYDAMIRICACRAWTVWPSCVR